MSQIRVLMADFKSYYPSPAYQLGLLVSYASTEPEVAKNIDFSFVECPTDRPAEEIASELLQADADLVAASSYTWTQHEISAVLGEFERSGRKVPPVLLGGPNAAGSFGAELMRRQPLVTAMVEGEGEPAFLDICRALVDGPGRDPFAEARNTVVRDGEGGVVRSNCGHRLQSLDEVPSPYLSGLLPAAPSPLFYETNRGCPYRCSFCYWGSGNAKIHRMSLERIRQELEFFARQKVAYLWLADANFGILKDDLEIAEMLASINARYGHPFRQIGVNWAKNSNDRVLEIASTLRRGGMDTSVTVALQSVTAEAEQASRRYSMSPSVFVHLIDSATERRVDTYTDLIWGLPGESVEEFLTGIEAVSLTGVPAIKIHQLVLLAGTEFWDRRQELGLVMASEAGAEDLGTSDGFGSNGCLVVRHPMMSPEEMRRGRRLMAINHLMHNHDLGRVVLCYLTRYGVTQGRVYDLLDRLLLGEAEDEALSKSELLADARALILDFAENLEKDEGYFYRNLSEVVWTRSGGGIVRQPRAPEVRSFLHAFFDLLCRRERICREPWERELLGELVDYNVLISPKPAWRPEPVYTFSWDVDAIWRDMLGELHGEVTEEEPTPTPAAWAEHARRVRSRLGGLLTDRYLEERRTPVAYEVSNSWEIAPARSSIEWVLGSGGRHATVRPVAAPGPTGSEGRVAAATAELDIRSGTR